MKNWLHKHMSGLVTNKDINSWNTTYDVLNRTLEIFKYEGLPTTIDLDMLEVILQTTGTVFITEHDGHLFAFPCSTQGPMDVYDRPTLARVQNVALGISKTYKIGIEGVLISNNTYQTALTPKVWKYAAESVEVELTLHMMSMLSRQPQLLEAKDQDAADAARQYLDDLIDGKYGVIQTNPLESESDIDTRPIASTTGAADILAQIQYAQYIEAQFWSDLGINLNKNIKSQYVNEGEIQQNQDATMPLIDNMLRNRQKGLNVLNALYGLDAKVKLTSAWTGHDGEDHGKDDEDEVIDKTEDGEETIIKEEDTVDSHEAEIEPTVEGDDLTIGEAVDTQLVSMDEEPMTEELEVFTNDIEEKISEDAEDNEEGEPEEDQSRDSDEDNESTTDPDDKKGE